MRMRGLCQVVSAGFPASVKSFIVTRVAADTKAFSAARVRKKPPAPREAAALPGGVRKYSSIGTYY